MPRIFLRSIPNAMCNESCGKGIKDALQKKGVSVEAIDFNLPARRCKAIIPDSVSLSDDEIEQALDDIGFSSFASQPNTSDVVKIFCKGLFGTSLGLILLILSAWGVAIPLILSLISLGIAIGLGYETCVQAWRTPALTLDTLFAVCTVIMLAVSITGLAFPLLGIKLLFDMVLLTFGIKYLGVVLQKYIRDDQMSGQSLLDRIPPDYTVQLKEGGKIALKNLEPGNSISLSAGQYIPVDVTCVSECAVTNAIADGQVTHPKVFSAGTHLNQGMNIYSTSDGEFKVVSTYKNSYCYKMYTHIRELENQQETTGFSQVLRYLVIAVIVIALITLCIFCIWHCAWQLTLNAIICVLTSACPCPIGLNPGLAAQVVKAKMQKKNIPCCYTKLLRAPLKHIVFDWNGTLIESEPSEITVVDLEQKHDLNKLVYRLEKNQPHPYARAICHKLTLRNPALVAEFEDENLPVERPNHSCIAGRIEGRHYRIGNADGVQGEIAQYKEIILAKEGKEAFACHQYIYIEVVESDKPQLMGYIKVSVKLREGAKQIINYYAQKKKMYVHICTGADEETVKAYLESAKIQNVIVHANCAALPENPQLETISPKRDKLTYVQGLQKQGAGVVGIGDAANDIPFLLQCDIGVAMQSPAADAMTQEVANFLVKSLFDLPPRLSKTEDILVTAARVKDNNDIISCVLSLLMMFIPLFMMGLWGVMCPPFLGPLLMLVPLLGVCINTKYNMTEQPTTKSRSAFPVPETTPDLFTPKKLGYPSPTLSSTSSPISSPRPSPRAPTPSPTADVIVADAELSHSTSFHRLS